MKKENGKKSTAKKVSKKREMDASHEFETMSQQQNRYGKGRQKSGSDGSSNDGRGSNH